jgi:site-specific recombinase XerD
MKKRRDASGQQKVVFRSVPVPPEFLDTLDIAHAIREAQKSRRKAVAPIWDISRVRVWQIVKRVMEEAGIPDAPHRSPKGLRHGFGVHAIVQGVPLSMLQRWLGHAQLSTTALYAEAVGKEEQHIAARMWG